MARGIEEVTSSSVSDHAMRSHMSYDACSVVCGVCSVQARQG